MARRKERNPKRKRTSLKRALLLVLLLWMLSTVFFGAVVTDLYGEIGALQATNASLTATVLALQEELGHAATRSDVEALAADLALLRQSYERAMVHTVPVPEGHTAIEREIGASPVSTAANQATDDGVGVRPIDPVPWYAVLADRVSLYGSQLLKAVAEAFRPRPVFH